MNAPLGLLFLWSASFVPLVLGQVPGFDLAWVEDAGIVMVVVVQGVATLYLFYKRIIVWGSTCDKLVANETAKYEDERDQRVESDRRYKTLAEDFSEHLKVILQMWKGSG